MRTVNDWLRRLFLGFALAGALVGFTACEDDAGDDLEDAADEIGDDIEDAGDEIDDEIGD